MQKNRLEKHSINHSRPLVALAPMAGVTDLPFRSICENLGADYSVTEMAASAPKLLHSTKNQARLHFTPKAKLKILQIIGNDAKEMADAAFVYAKLGAHIIDINLGCPAKKVSSKGAGSALLSNLKKVRDIVKSVTQRCPVPVTVKTRLGPNHDNYTLLSVGEIITELGIKQITVHGRTRACKFNGRAQFDEIAKLKQTFPELTVIANGDIDCLEKAKDILAKTRCDGFMIGRGCVGNPWLFSDIQSHFDPTLSSPSHSKTDLILKHIRQTHAFYGDSKGVKFARKHIQAYLKHLQLSEHFKSLSQLEIPEKQLYQLMTIIEKAHHEK